MCREAVARRVSASRAASASSASRGTASLDPFLQRFERGNPVLRPADRLLGRPGEIRLQPVGQGPGLGFVFTRELVRPLAQPFVEPQTQKPHEQILALAGLCAHEGRELALRQHNALCEVVEAQSDDRVLPRMP